jgi:hypothetical protein
VKVLSSEAGTAELIVRHGRRVERRPKRTIGPGVSVLRWNTRGAAPRRYRLSVFVRTLEGRFASDVVYVRVRP